MAEFNDFKGLAEQADELRGSVTDTMHAVMKRTGLSFNEAMELFNGLANKADGVQAVAHRLWWEADGEFWCSSCDEVRTKPWRGASGKYHGEIDGHAPDICRNCQEAENADAEATNRLVCRGTPYQY